MVPATTASLPAFPWNIPAGEWVHPAYGGGSLVARELTASTEQRILFLQTMEKSVTDLEVWLGSAGARELEPKQYAFVRAQARLMLAQCDVIVAAMEGEYARADAATRQRFDDLCDRLDEIVDTLGWSAEAADKLGALIREEMCA
jgi:hypothetical protein